MKDKFNFAIGAEYRMRRVEDDGGIINEYYIQQYNAPHVHFKDGSALNKDGT